MIFPVVYSTVTMKLTVCICVYVIFFVLLFFYQVASLLGVSLFWQPATHYINFVCYAFVNVRCG